MGIKLTELEENTPVIFHIRNQEHQMALGGILRKHLENNLAVITLDYNGTQRLSFDNVQIDMEIPQENGIPLLWTNVKIIFYKNTYIMQPTADGIRNNRRNSFRVPVGKQAWFSMYGRDSQYVNIKDISLSGFSISDRTRKLKLSKGSLLSVSFEDLGYRLDLDGRVVRIEERNDIIIYGLAITNLCRDLAAYISVKQRPGRK